MSEVFNPYHKWLGIPPAEQPPNHYRLLGIERFESDPDVIDTAAQARMVHLRSYQIGKNSALSQKLLNEVSAARVTLLDPQKRAAYDEQLRRELQPQPAPHAPVAAKPQAQRLPVPAGPSPVRPVLATAQPLPAPSIAPSASPVRVNTRLGKRRKNAWLVPAAAGLAGLAAVGLLVLILGQNRHPSLAESATATGRDGASVPSPTAVDFAVRPASPGATRTGSAPSDDKATTQTTPPPLAFNSDPAPADVTASADDRLPTAPGAVEPRPTPAGQVRPAGAQPPDPSPTSGDDSPPASLVSASPPDVSKPRKVPLGLPLIALPPEKKVLLITRLGDLSRAIEVCDSQGIQYENGSFDITDYSSYHTIMVGSNAMDYWGAREERKQPEAFQPVEDFVNNGGHLIVMGTWNGRNMGHLKRFGITTGYSHKGHVDRVEGHTDALLKGVEHLFPADGRMQSVGNFRVSVPHVVLLNRQSAQTPALVTLVHGKGRVTFTLCEPHYKKEYWVVTVLMTWASRGSPTHVEDDLATTLAGTDFPAPLPVEPSALPPGTERPRSLEDLLTSKPLAANRSPVPDEAKRQEAEKLVKEIYRDQMAAAKTPAETKALAGQMLLTAGGSHDDPASQYALYQEVRNLTLSQGEAELAFAATDAFVRQFDVSVGEFELDTLTRLLARPSRDAALAFVSVRRCLDVAADCIDEDAFEIATQLTSLAVAHAARTQSRHLRNMAPIADKRAKLLWREYQRVSSQRETLAAEDSDPAANLELGKFYCFAKGDWQRGLAHLALGGDEDLKSLATRERRGQLSPEDAEQLGDDWVAVTERLTSEERPVAQQRARHWYAKAAEPARGFTKAQIEAKLGKLPSPQVQLKVHVKQVHGSEQLHLSPNTMHWVHQTGSLPGGIIINDMPWSLNEGTSIPNRGATHLLPLDFDPTTVKVQKVRGRGTVRAEFRDGTAIIHIQDTANGADDYDFIVTFGS